MIKIWSKESCPYCVRAKNLCEQKDMNMNIKHVRRRFH